MITIGLSIIPYRYRQACDEVKSQKLQIEDLQQDVRARDHQICSLQDAVTNHKASADHAVLEIQRLGVVQKSMTEKEQQLRLELGESSGEVILAKERISVLEIRCQQQARDLKEVTEARSLADSDVTSLKVP